MSSISVMVNVSDFPRYKAMKFCPTLTFFSFNLAFIYPSISGRFRLYFCMREGREITTYLATVRFANSKRVSLPVRGCWLFLFFLDIIMGNYYHIILSYCSIIVGKSSTCFFIFTISYPACWERLANSSLSCSTFFMVVCIALRVIYSSLFLLSR